MKGFVSQRQKDSEIFLECFKLIKQSLLMTMVSKKLKTVQSSFELILL